MKVVAMDCKGDRGLEDRALLQVRAREVIFQLVRPLKSQAIARLLIRMGAAVTEGTASSHLIVLVHSACVPQPYLNQGQELSGLIRGTGLHEREDRLHQVIRQQVNQLQGIGVGLGHRG